ncbi:hypothetical protein BCY91_08230 [Pelobium manganitolerans]|uniref:Trm112 family protein n=1 Tax=Pelobium manganitolerans TaxID=1842495 RepID=A0A419S465_9SPHI|nr:Trm112 family protein [Pelobium manganitolerans]RKD14450.1 hypothetical protein BCY91_08230 [Pelobium manganitolerans]
MKTTTFNKLCCPFDKGDLNLEIIGQDLDGNILEGILNCQSCKRVYPIVSGIPIMSPDEYREFRLEKPLLNRMVGERMSSDFRLIEQEN